MPTLLRPEWRRPVRDPGQAKKMPAGQGSTTGLYRAGDCRQRAASAWVPEEASGAAGCCARRSAARRIGAGGAQWSRSRRPAQEVVGQGKRTDLCQKEHRRAGTGAGTDSPAGAVAPAGGKAWTLMARCPSHQAPPRLSILAHISCETVNGCGSRGHPVHPVLDQVVDDGG
ncbi:MAG: hypothetical protein ACLFOB_13510, partial [Rhodosalinus sp.]